MKTFWVAKDWRLVMDQDNMDRNYHKDCHDSIKKYCMEIKIPLKAAYQLQDILHDWDNPRKEQKNQKRMDEFINEIKNNLDSAGGSEE